MMAHNKHLKTLGRRGLSFFMALVMAVSLIQITAFAAEEPEYNVGDPFTSQEEAATLPTTIPDGTYWDGPAAETVYKDEYTCGYEDNEVIWSEDLPENWEDIDAADFVAEDTEHYKQETVETVTWTYENHGGNTKTYTGDRYRQETGDWGTKYYVKDNETGTYGWINKGLGYYTVLTKVTGSVTTYSRLKFTTHEHTDEACKEVDRVDYTWTLKAITISSVTIQDNIATDGVLTAAVTIGQNGVETPDSVTYQWYKNDEAITGATGETLSAFDGHTAVITAPNVYTVKAFASANDTVGVLSAEYTAQYYTALQNGSFETPELTNRNQNLANGTAGLYWKTTGRNAYGADGIELFNENSYGKNSTSSSHFYNQDAVSFPDGGTQAAEINAESYGALYQDVLTEPGSTLYWSFSHRGRSGDDTMALVIVDQTASVDISNFGQVPTDYIQVQATDGNTKWTSYASDSHGYTVPAGQYVTRFYFVAVDAAGGATIGNLLDAVTFNSTPAPNYYSWEINYYVDGTKVNGATESASAQAGAVIQAAKHNTYLESYNFVPGATSLTVSESGTNVLDLHYTTPDYTVEYYTMGEGASEYTKVTNTTGLTISGKAAYGTDVRISSLNLPEDLTVAGVKYDFTETAPASSLTMRKNGTNVIKVYYDYVAPVTYTINYAWTTDSDARPSGVSLPVTSEGILDLSTFTPSDVPTTSVEGYAITGWHTDAAHTMSFVQGTTALTDGQTLYAHCTYTEPTNYNVAYMWATGSETFENKLPVNRTNITLAERKTIAVNALTGLPEGNTFEGWYTDAAHTIRFTDTTLAGVTDKSITLYAYVTYAAPTRTYSVDYHLTYTMNGKSSEKTVANVTTGSITQAASENTRTIYNAEAAKLANGYVDDGKTYTLDAYAAGTNPAVTGTWGTNNLKYTIELSGSAWTTGSLKIVKTISGLSEAPEGLSFTVTGPDSYNETISYADFTNGSYTLSGLTVGQYTVRENNQEVTGYILATTVTGDDDGQVSGYQANVSAGANPKVLTFKNSYEGKTYTITFDAGNHGTAKNINGNAVSGIWAYTWEKFSRPVEGESNETGYAWSGALTTGEGSKVSYTFTQAAYQEFMNTMSITKPGLTVEDGYLNDGAFYNGETAFDTLIASVNAMNKAQPNSLNPSIAYTAKYTAGTDTGYTVEYYYQQADGTYADTATSSVSRSDGTTGLGVSVTKADKTPTVASYEFAVNNAKNVLSVAQLSGKGDTKLKVYFQWRAGVRYQYSVSDETLLDAITAAHALPVDNASYLWGNETTNLGTIGATYPVSGGVWTLTSWTANPANGVVASSDGVVYTGNWTYEANDEATVRVQFVDENGNILRDPMSQTASHGTAYDLSAAEDVETLVVDGFTYELNTQYEGAFQAGKTDYETLDYTGSIPSTGRTITRVYAVMRSGMQITKSYNIATLPAGFTVTVTDAGNGAVAATLTAANAEVVDGQLLWVAQLPVGRTYTFTESGYSNGFRWSTVLTAQKYTSPVNMQYTWVDLAVSGMAFNVEFTVNDVNAETAMVRMVNTYTYNRPDRDDDDDDDRDPVTPPVIIEDPETPTTDLPETDVPTVEVPTTEPATELEEPAVPMAEAPKTGDSLIAWVVAAAVSGAGLVWLTLSGRKRREDDAQ